MDTYSEEYRHECEARTAARMPLLQRQAHLSNVEKKRGVQARRQLEDTMFKFWVTAQVVKLQGMNQDEQQYHLGKIERATNERWRKAVEDQLNQGSHEHPTSEE